MNNIILFKSKKQITAENNYNEFINFCRYQLSGLTQTQDWEQYVWKGYVTFRKIGVGHKAFNSKDAMHEDFLDFAKAYIRYQHSLKPLKNYGATMMALRCLEQALLQVLNSGLIYNITAVVFDEAMQIGSKYFEGNVLAQCGIQLEKLSKFLCEHNLVKSGYISWKNHVKQKVKNNYLPEIEDYHRNDKLPDESALLAIADIFSKNDELLSPRDKFTSSVFALLLCCPSRISEILALPADCEITQKDEKGIEKYGLRFYSVKGYGPNIKWIPQVMIPVAKKSIRRLLSLSQNARAMAYKANELHLFFNFRRGVKITTCHSTKGDEYEVVICTGLLNGKIPNWNDIINCSSEHQNYVARRLLYVVSSRAKKHLYMISERGYKTKRGYPYQTTPQL